MAQLPAPEPRAEIVHDLVPSETVTEPVGVKPEAPVTVTV
jgi:hypothetical protein